MAASHIKWWIEVQEASFFLSLLMKECGLWQEAAHMLQTAALCDFLKQMCEGHCNS